MKFVYKFTKLSELLLYSKHTLIKTTKLSKNFIQSTRRNVISKNIFYFWVFSKACAKTIFL